MQIDRQPLAGDLRPGRTGRRRIGRLAQGVAGAAIVAALAMPGVAHASAGHASHRHARRHATSSRMVAADMLAGASEFTGTQPVCRTIIAGAKYRCTISGGAPYYNLPNLTYAEQTQLTLAPPGFVPPPHGQRLTPAQLAAGAAYQEQLLEGWGWTPTQADEYASGSFPDIYAGEFGGVNEPTVNAVTERANGGCVSLDSTGSVWDCYLGQAAVRAGQATPGFLGQKVSGPISK